MGNSAGRPIPFKKSWSDQKEKLKQKFPSLTNEDLQYENGGAIQMLTRVQEKLGVTREEFVIILETL